MGSQTFGRNKMKRTQLRALYDSMGVNLCKYSTLPKEEQGEQVLGAFEAFTRNIYLRKDITVFVALHELAHYTHFHNYRMDFLLSPAIRHELIADMAVCMIYDSFNWWDRIDKTSSIWQNRVKDVHEFLREHGEEIPDDIIGIATSVSNRIMKHMDDVMA